MARRASGEYDKGPRLGPTVCFQSRFRGSVWAPFTPINTPIFWIGDFTMPLLDQIIQGFLFTLGALLLFVFGAEVGFFDGF